MENETKRGPQFRWFAWRPVNTKDRGWRWLCFVWSNRVNSSFEQHSARYFEYRVEAPDWWKDRCSIDEEWGGLFIGRRSCSTHNQRWDDGGPCPAKRREGLKVEIIEHLYEPRVCKVWRDGVLVFHGKDLSASLSSKPRVVID